MNEKEFKIVLKTLKLTSVKPTVSLNRELKKCKSSSQTNQSWSISINNIKLASERCDVRLFSTIDSAWNFITQNFDVSNLTVVIAQ